MTDGYYGCWENSDKSVVRCFVWKSNGHLRHVHEARSEPKVGAETETEEQQKLKTRNDASTEQPMLDARDSDACVRAMHVHHEEETRAPLMRVTSEVRLDQATWSPNARTLRMVMKMRLVEIACVPCACKGSSPLSILGLNRCCRANTTSGPCCTSPDTEEHIRIMVSWLYRNLSVVESASRPP